MELVDTHCHIDVEAFDTDREHVLKRCREQGVSRLVVPAIDIVRWDGLLDLCHREKGLYPALGLHPVYLDSHMEAHVQALEYEVDKHRPVAVGEIGLDYFIQDLDRPRQQKLFEAQLEIARNSDLPVILHVRKAHDRVLSTLKRIRVKGGTAHAFNGSMQQAQQYIDLGFKLGFGGMLTYERSNKIRRLAKQVPAEALVLETDAPDMTVSSHQGERNSPEYLPDCLRSLAEVRNESAEDLARQTTKNACTVFHLDEYAV